MPAATARKGKKNWTRSQAPRKSNGTGFSKPKHATRTESDSGIISDLDKEEGSNKARRIKRNSGLGVGDAMVEVQQSRDRQAERDSETRWLRFDLAQRQRDQQFEAKQRQRDQHHTAQMAQLKHHSNLQEMILLNLQLQLEKEKNQTRAQASKEKQ